MVSSSKSRVHTRSRMQYCVAQLSLMNMHLPPPTLFCALSLSLSAHIVVKPGTKMLSMSSVSHVSVKHIKLLRRKSPSNRMSAVSSSVLFWRARTFDRVIVGRGCLLPCFFSRSLTPPLDPCFLLFFSFPITSTMSKRLSFKSGHGVWRWKENKNSCVQVYARWWVSHVRVHPQRKLPAQSHAEGSTPPQTEYTSLPSSYTCMHTFTNVQRPQETQQHNDETAN